MLQKSNITRHQRWSCEPEDLPERKVPWHHRQHWANWFKSHIAFCGLGADKLIGEELTRHLCIVTTNPRALFSLAHGRLKGLTHFCGHQLCERAFLVFD